MKVAVIGGGNIGTLMAAEFAHKGEEVSIYTSDPSRWSNDITVNDEMGNKLFVSHISLITNEIKKAIEGANYILVALPSFMYDDLAKEIIPHLSAGQRIGFVPGSGGPEYSFSKALDKGAVIFGLQRVHSISRLDQYGHSVNMLGRKSALQVATIPNSICNDVAMDLENLFDLPCERLPNYLSVTLTPSNPILHTSRLYAMFKDKQKYDHNILFYEEWTDESSSILFACDNELQLVLEKISDLDLSNVISLPLYYESKTPEQLTNKIISIKAFKGITSPMIEGDGEWAPDYHSRYFTEDFPYGLQIIKQIAVFCDVPTPNIDEILEWYDTIKVNNNQFCFSDYGFATMEQIVEYNCQ